MAILFLPWLINSVAPAFPYRPVPAVIVKEFLSVTSAAEAFALPMLGILFASSTGRMFEMYVDTDPTTAVTRSCTAVRAHWVAVFGSKLSLQVMIFNGCPLTPPALLMAAAAASADEKTSG